MMPPRRPTVCPDPGADVPSGGDAAVLLGVFARIADRWRLDAADRRALLGVTPATAAAWLGSHPPRTLPPAVRARVGHVVAIDLALQAFYGLGSPHADAHVRRPGTAPGGVGSALAAMRAGLDGLARVRRDLDARLARCG